MTLDESGRLAGAACWTESKLFEVLGQWVASTTEPAAKLLVDRHSQHHAWRAGQWWDRLPVVADVERDNLLSPPTRSMADLLGELAAADGTVARLAGAYRVALPRLAAVYRGHRGAASPVSDASTLRTLDLVEPDLWADWRDGEVLLQSLVTSPEAAETAASTVARLERIVAQARF